MPEQPFDPAGAVVFTEDKDLMTHCSAFLYDGSERLYLAYYRDTVQLLENPAMKSITPVLAVADYPSVEVKSRTEYIHTGQTIGSFTQSPDRAPYDPNLLLMGDTLFCYFVGCVGSDVTICARRYDTVSGQFADEVETCRLRYGSHNVPFSAVCLWELQKEMGLEEATFNNDVLLSCRFVPYKGEWYAAVGTAFHKRSCPVVVKTSNGVDFDVVMICPEFLFGCCEAALAILDDEFYVIERNSGVERGGRGCYIAKYSPDGACLVAPQYLSEAQSKPALIVHRGSVYAFYNANPFLFTDWGLVSRSRLRIARIGKGCEVLESRDVTSPYGIHYPYLGEIDGDVYMTYTSDYRQLDIAQTRSNLCFTRVDL